MSIAVLYPFFEHPAVEERYASWQTRMLLRGGEQANMLLYERDTPSRDLMTEVDEDHVLVVTDPLLIPMANLGARLREVLLETGASAVVPRSNVAGHPAQLSTGIAPYLTLRELQAVMEEMAAQPSDPEVVEWDGSDPGMYFCESSLLRDVREAPPRALGTRKVAISRRHYVHRWGSLRGQTRHDLLARIGPDAKNVLEFGCGEAPLGEALKKRQKCRVVGIELDPAAAAIAKKRIDDVYCGDVRELVGLLKDQFDWIIGGDIVEHLDDPWSFLYELRRISTADGRLLLSIPNLSNSSIVADLLQGRFDYVYMGLTCVGHLRFFTRQTIEEMLTISGWSVEEIAPQHFPTTPAAQALLDALDKANVDYKKEQLTPAGYTVIARNRR